MGETAGLVTKHYREQLLFKNSNIFRPPERRSYSATKELVSKELNSLFEEHAGANVSVCTSEEWVDMTLSYWGLMYLAPESNLDEKDLNTFLNPLGPIGTIKMDSPDGLRHVSFLQRRPHRIEIFQSNKATLVLPSWCRMWPYPADNCKWQQYTSAILSGNKLCFWPSIPKQEGAGDSAVHLNTTVWASKFGGNGTKVDQIMVAGGFFDNFWHAAAIFNTWCNIKHQEDVHFLVQSESMPSVVPIVANALGIQRSRIIHHTSPVLAESVLMAPYHGNVDWSCLHGALSTTSKQERDFIVVYFRGWDDPSRNIPEDIHHQFVSVLSHTFKHLQVKTFSGNETFEDTRELFQRARVVVGPHGAGMVNLVFCKEGTPVIEFTVHSLLNRPWQAMGAQSFGLKWWPVLLKNFSSADEITASVSIVKHALALS